MKNLLIVVDMINAFCHTKGTLAKSLVTGEFYGQQIIPAVKGLVDIYRNNQEPIIWLHDNHAPDDKEFDRFPPHAIKDTWEAAVVDDLDSGAIEKSPFELLMPKTRYSGFFGTDLAYQLLRLAPEKVSVCGVCTSICVMDTVGGLANRDYNIIVNKSCVADFDPDGHAAALSRMKGLYGAKII